MMIATGVSNSRHQLLQKDTLGITKATTEFASESFNLLLSSRQCLISWQTDELYHYAFFKRKHLFAFHSIYKYLLASALVPFGGSEGESFHASLLVSGGCRQSLACSSSLDL